MIKPSDHASSVIPGRRVSIDAGQPRSSDPARPRIDRRRAARLAIPLDARLSLLATGRFVTLLPGSALRLPRRRDDVRALPIRIEGTVTNALVTLRRRPVAPPVDTFIAAARTLARRLEGPGGP